MCFSADNSGCISADGPDLCRLSSLMTLQKPNWSRAETTLYFHCWPICRNIFTNLSIICCPYNIRKWWRMSVFPLRPTGRPQQIFIFQTATKIIMLWWAQLLCLCVTIWESVSGASVWSCMYRWISYMILVSCFTCTQQSKHRAHGGLTLG